MIPALGRQRERQIPGVPWPASLVYLLISRPVRNPVSKEGIVYLRKDTFTCTHVYPHTHDHVHRANKTVVDDKNTLYHTGRLMLDRGKGNPGIYTLLNLNAWRELV